MNHRSFRSNNTLRPALKGGITPPILTKGRLGLYIFGILEIAFIIKVFFYSKTIIPMELHSVFMMFIAYNFGRKLVKKE
jgi:hypothetical protein